MTPQALHAWLRQTPRPGRAHLVGAGGCGVSALGHLLLDQGWEVSGSDLVVNEDVERLRARGARIIAGHAAELLFETEPGLVAYSSAVPPENPELQAARALGVPVVTRATLLAALMGDKQAVCVAGMHGKTTSAAMLAVALEQLGAAPSYAIGAFVPQLGGNARWVDEASPRASQARQHRQPCLHPSPSESQADAADLWAGTLFVAETDESDGTLTQFEPTCALVLNIDKEHLDHFADVEAVRAAFRQFIVQTRGPLVYCADDAHLPELIQARPAAVSYGFNAKADYRIELPTPLGAATANGEAHARCVIHHRNEAWPELRLRVWGRQNISNACGVAALLHQLGFTPEAIIPALAHFRGVARRQEKLLHTAQVRVFTDYGHHPVEIQLTLEAFRAITPGRLLVGFQPHRYTRTQHLLEDFRAAFDQADRLWIADIYAASESPIPGVSGQRLASAIAEYGTPAEYVPSLEALCTAIRSALQPGDTVLFLGAGDIDQAARAFARSLQS